jgi:hypothetical protein
MVANGDAKVLNTDEIRRSLRVIASLGRQIPTSASSSDTSVNWKSQVVG